MRRLLVVVVASMVLLWPQPAGARQYHDLLWAPTASSTHVAHCVRSGAHVVCSVVWSGWDALPVAGVFVAEWCRLEVTPGNGWDPLVLRWVSDVPAGSCAPDVGVFPWVDGRFATAREGWVFPRDGGVPWARSTVLEIR